MQTPKDSDTGTSLRLIEDKENDDPALSFNSSAEALSSAQSLANAQQKPDKSARKTAKKSLQPARPPPTTIGNSHPCSSDGSDVDDVESAAQEKTPKLQKLAAKKTCVKEPATTPCEPGNNNSIQEPKVDVSHSNTNFRLEAENLEDSNTSNNLQTPNVGISANTMLDLPPVEHCMMKHTRGLCKKSTVPGSRYCKTHLFMDPEAQSQYSDSRKRCKGLLKSKNQQCKSVLKDTDGDYCKSHQPGAHSTNTDSSDEELNKHGPVITVQTAQKKRRGGNQESKQRKEDNDVNQTPFEDQTEAQRVTVRNMSQEQDSDGNLLYTDKRCTRCQKQKAKCHRQWPRCQRCSLPSVFSSGVTCEYAEDKIISSSSGAKAKVSRAAPQKTPMTQEELEILNSDDDPFDQSILDEIDIQGVIECTFCGKLNAEDDMEMHEQVCAMNPGNRYFTPASPSFMKGEQMESKLMTGKRTRSRTQKENERDRQKVKQSIKMELCSTPCPETGIVKNPQLATPEMRKILEKQKKQQAKMKKEEEKIQQEEQRRREQMRIEEERKRLERERREQKEREEVEQVEILLMNLSESESDQENESAGWGEAYLQS